MTADRHLTKPIPPTCTNASSSKPTTAAAATPRKRKQPATAGKVRFSDPGPILTEGEDELSTGLTPMIRRTSLGLQKRRQSTPARPSSPDVKEVHFLPLRQVLDGRVKRRIRRSGLSEEMNVITRDKKKRAQEVEAELDRLRAELAAKDEEIHRLHDETVEIDSDRIWDLEQQVKALKERLVFRSHDDRQPLLSSSPGGNWGAAARDPFVDDFMDLDHEGGDAGFGESTVADFMCSTPDRRLRMSFPTPPTTSPARADPLTPCIREIQHMPTPLSHVAEELKDELESLQREVTKLTATLESYTTLTTRLSDKLSPFPPSSPTPSSPTDLEPRLTHLLTLLSDRTTALSSLSASLTTLGFGTGPPTAILHTLTTTLRTARLELEYLAPGECPLPLSSSGAAILDLLLTRLRALAKSNREADEHIDEYHALELSLRQQLAARVSAMGTLHAEVARMEGEVRARDGRVADLEIGMERAKGALGRYARDVGELEGLVGVLEKELEAAVAGRAEDKGGMEAVVRGQRAELAARVRTIEELEGRLGEAVARTAELQTRVAEVEVRCAREVEEVSGQAKAERERMGRAQGTALALRDARVAELRGEVERVNAALRVAYETVKELRVENARLKAQNGGLGKSSGAAPKRLRRDSGLEEGEGAGEAPRSTEKRGSLLGGELAKKGKKRRKYDSGLGFLDEEEVAM
ncbi:hypothetical protein B0T18DRAFT_437173 [Schizothecium vesticola]|uniref:Uncharacterized protein n=1 Tax=Schizothecium vesticola TaxID=314040 RepID=A0AA40F2J0_9PEZI|nr:hypothetical protein B0T18DRAFT_437173 [Schizothecium vesticola]